MEERINVDLANILELADDQLLDGLLVVVEDLAEPVQPNLLEGRHRARRPRNENFIEETVPRFTDDLFKEHFRMSRGTFQNLCLVIGNIIGNDGDHITVEKKVLFTIWTLAKPESFLAVGDRFGLAKSSGHVIFKQIIGIIADLMPQYIRFPNEQQMLLSATNFQARSHGFPGVVGAIDGCHIPIKQPTGNAQDYYNRKQFHSIILQGTCDHQGRFIDCFIGMPGRMHDARVFRNSPLYQRIMDAENPLIGQQYHLIADSAYPLLLNVMCPFRDNQHLTPEQVRYNIKLSSIRSIIERAFGMLKGKFRRLKCLDVSDMQLANNMVAAGCVLHNFLIENNDLNIHEEIYVEYEVLELVEENAGIGNNQATLKRNNIVLLL